MTYLKTAVCPKCKEEYKFGDFWDSPFCVLCKPRKEEHELTNPIQGKWSRMKSLEREVHAADIAQPLNKDGTINEHFLKEYGTKVYEKELGIKNPKPYKRKYF